MGPAVLEPWPLLYDGKENAGNSNCKLSSNVKEFCLQKGISCVTENEKQFVNMPSVTKKHS